jgi:hypothetical protein
MEELVLSFGEFYHVTCRGLWEEGISRTGLDPTKGAECCAGRCDPSVFLCTRQKLEKSISMIGSKFCDQDELVVVTIDARALLGKRLIGDVTYQRAVPNLETSLREAGNMGCLDPIRPDEFTRVEFIKNLDRIL